jgi:hypothetical protein
VVSPWTHTHKAAFNIVDFQCPTRLGTLKIGAAFSVRDEDEDEVVW